VNSVGDKEMSAGVQEFLTKYRQDASDKKNYACGPVIDFLGGKGAFETLPDSIKDSMEPLMKNNIRHWDIGSLIRSDLTDLEKCVVPTRLVYGDQSNPVASSICDHLSEHITNSKKYEIKGVSQFLITSHTVECIQALSDQSFF
jgi:hypothetical protein